MRRTPQWRWANILVWLVVIAEILIIVLPASAAGSIVAATAGLAVAFVAYPWQKEIDRELSLDAELRRAYAAYLRAESQLIVSSQSATRVETRGEAMKVFNDAFAELTAQLKLVQLIAPKPVSKVLGEHFMAVGHMAFAAAHGVPEENTAEEILKLVDDYNKAVSRLNEALQPAFFVQFPIWRQSSSRMEHKT